MSVKVPLPRVVTNANPVVDRDARPGVRFPTPATLSGVISTAKFAPAKVLVNVTEYWPVLERVTEATP